MRPVPPPPRAIAIPVSKLRKYAGFVIMFALMSMLIISFGLWGIGDMLRLGGRNSEVAHVGGTHIPLYGWFGGTGVTVEEVRDRFNRQIEQIQRQTGQRPEPEAALRYGLHIRALDDVVQRAVIDNAIREYGLAISMAEVQATIARNPSFAGTGGAFDANRYRSLLQQARIPEAAYVADVRREIATVQLFGVVRSEGLAPVSLRDELFKGQGEKRIAGTIYVPDSIVVNVPSPTPEQLTAYFEANKTKFQIPEYRSFSYVMLTVDDVMPQVTVTPEQVKQEYDARQGEFGKPEKRDVDQAMADSEEKAKKVIAGATGGKSLEDAAKEVLGTADGVIKLGEILKKDLPAGPLADGVFSAPLGLAPAPIQSPLGWHVIRINKIDAGQVTPFDQVKEKLEKDLKAQLAPDLLIKLVTDFERVLSKTQSMATAAQDLQLKVKSVENVDARGQDMAGKDVALGPAGVAVLQAAFATRESSESELLETQNGEYFVVRTERITPARIPALTEVEAKVKEAWQNDERRKLADAKVKEAVDKANAGTDMATIAKDLGLELRTANAVTRFDADTGNYLTQPAAQELFKLPVGKVVSVRSAQGSVILRANEIIPVDLTKEKEPLDRFGKQLDITIGNDLIAQLLAGLRQKYGVSINEAAFTAAFQSQQPQQ